MIKIVGSQYHKLLYQWFFTTGMQANETVCKTYYKEANVKEAKKREWKAQEGVKFIALIEEKIRLKAAQEEQKTLDPISKAIIN